MSDLFLDCFIRNSLGMAAYYGIISIEIERQFFLARPVKLVFPRPVGCFWRPIDSSHIDIGFSKGPYIRFNSVNKSKTIVHGKLTNILIIQD